MLMLEVQQRASRCFTACHCYFIMFNRNIYHFHIFSYRFVSFHGSLRIWMLLIKYDQIWLTNSSFWYLRHLIYSFSMFSVYRVPSCCMFILQFLNWFSAKFLGSPGMPIRTSLAIGCCVALQKLHAGLKRSTLSICSFADFTSSLSKSRNVRSHSLGRWK